MSTREELTRQAEKALRQGRVDEAIAHYQELAYLEPVDWGLVKQLADLFERAGQREAAARQFARWGDHLFVEGFHSKAAALYKKVLKLEPADEHALWQLAEVSLELKLKADARVAFQRVADLRQRRGDAAGALAARERLSAIEAAPVGPSAAPVRPPAYAAPPGAPPSSPGAPPLPTGPQAFVRPARPGLWAGSPGAPDDSESIAPPPETQEARLARLRRDAEAADASHAPDADQRWQAVLDADPQDVAVRLRLVQAAMDRGDLPTAERLGESLDAAEDPALTALVELAYRRARPDALQRLVAGRVQAGAPPEHVLAPCMSLAGRQPGAARAVLAAAVTAWTAAGQPGHAVLALEHGESLGLLTTAMHLQRVEICVDAGLPGLSRAQRGLALAYVAEQRFAEARAVAEDLFVREAGEEPHRALLLDILDRQGHPEPHRVLVDLLTPPSDSLDDTDAMFAPAAPVEPVAPAFPTSSHPDDYGYLPPLRIPEPEQPSAQEAAFIDTGDSSIAMLDVDALLAADAAATAGATPASWSDAPEVPAPSIETDGFGDDGGLPSDDASIEADSALGGALESASDEPPQPSAGEPSPIESVELQDQVGPAQVPGTAAAAGAMFDWASILGRDVDSAAIAPPPAAAPPPMPLVAAPAPPVEDEVPPVVAPPAPAELRAPVAPPAPLEPPAPRAVDTSPFARLSELQPALDDDAPLQPSFAMPSTWLSDSTGPQARPRERNPEDDYLFAEELPARWERSRLGIPSPALAKDSQPEAQRDAASDRPGGPDEPSGGVVPVVVDPMGSTGAGGAAGDEVMSETSGRPGPTDEPSDEPAADATPVVEEEVDLTQLLEELRQFDTVLPDPAPRPSPDAVVTQGALPVPAPERVSPLAEEAHHDEPLLPEPSPPSPHEGMTELDAVFDDLQRHADDRSVAEQQVAAGRVFLAAGLASEAARAFERASLEPRSRFAASLALAELHRSRGQLQEAVSWYEQAAMAPVPDAAVKRPVLYDLAESLEAIGETDRAVGVLLDLLSQVEDYRDARARLDRLLRVDAGG
ncbi:hypothetical protein TBR22_A31160 [Luteitalea sp. TBR-22]|uniref:tetratricopeptide repeat protein n=1 Tax=Luteitalea sp. TBR-22 TaxID=2802971 RepID=UPI001AF95F9C|nr:tetratricopeptide repeat protein [Luteitalea sp. TBR-22]BCS33888.1 hypothetical protein TBR22_A31160 [Luteitalea sp. TBR-22]